MNDPGIAVAVGYVYIPVCGEGDVRRLEEVRRVTARDAFHAERQQAAPDPRHLHIITNPFQNPFR